MVVTWVTMQYTEDSIVEYNKKGGPLDLKATGSVTKFVDGGSEHRTMYIHRVKLTGLVPEQYYGIVLDIVLLMIDDWLRRGYMVQHCVQYYRQCCRSRIISYFSNDVCGKLCCDMVRNTDACNIVCNVATCVRL